MDNIAKTIPDKQIDARLKQLQICPGGISVTAKGVRCKGLGY